MKITYLSTPPSRVGQLIPMTEVLPGDVFKELGQDLLWWRNNARRERMTHYTEYNSIGYFANGNAEKHKGFVEIVQEDFVHED